MTADEARELQAEMAKKDGPVTAPGSAFLVAILYEIVGRVTENKNWLEFDLPHSIRPRGTVVIGDYLEQELTELGYEFERKGNDNYVVRWGGTEQ